MKVGDLKKALADFDDDQECLVETDHSFWEVSSVESIEGTEAVPEARAVRLFCDEIDRKPDGIWPYLEVNIRHITERDWEILQLQVKTGYVQCVTMDDEAEGRIFFILLAEKAVWKEGKEPEDTFFGNLSESFRKCYKKAWSDGCPLLVIRTDAAKFDDLDLN